MKRMFQKVLNKIEKTAFLLKTTCAFALILVGSNYNTRIHLHLIYLYEFLRLAH